MTKRELEKLRDGLEKVTRDYCDFCGAVEAGAVCDPDACPACISGFYEDECAFEVVSNALNDLIKQEGNKDDEESKK